MTDKQKELYDKWSKMDIYIAYLDEHRKTEIYKKQVQLQQKQLALHRFKCKHTRNVV